MLPRGSRLNFDLLLAILVGLWLCTTPAIASAQQAPSSVQLRPAMLLWNVGLEEGRGGDKLIETITPATWQDRDSWRVTHYSSDPNHSKINAFDLYDLDRQSMAPLRSVSNSKNGKLELEYSNQSITVRSSTHRSRRSEKIKLRGPLLPEGPGLTALVATLPLQVGYTLNYQIVDRWSGNENSRLKNMTLRVTSRAIIASALGPVDCFEIFIQPTDNSFEIHEYAIAAGLHWPVRMTYTRRGTKLTSEVIAIAVANE